MRHNGRKKLNVFWYFFILYNEFPREEEFVDFDEEELRPPRRRDTNDKHRSLDEGLFSHSDCKHCSSVGRSDDRIDKHCSINCTHSK